MVWNSLQIEKMIQFWVLIFVLVFDHCRSIMRDELTAHA